MSVVFSLPIFFSKIKFAIPDISLKLIGLCFCDPFISSNILRRLYHDGERIERVQNRHVQQGGANVCLIPMAEQSVISRPNFSNNFTLANIYIYLNYVWLAWGSTQLNKFLTYSLRIGFA